MGAFRAPASSALPVVLLSAAPCWRCSASARTAWARLSIGSNANASLCARQQCAVAKAAMRARVAMRSAASSSVWAIRAKSVRDQRDGKREPSQSQPPGPRGSQFLGHHVPLHPLEDVVRNHREPIPRRVRAELSTREHPGRQLVLGDVVHVLDRASSPDSAHTTTVASWSKLARVSFPAAFAAWSRALASIASS